VLRLRGGGGYQWFLSNKRDSQKTELVLEQNVMESSELVEKLAKHLKIKDD